MRSFLLHAADVVQSSRFAFSRFMKNKLYLPWSALQFIASIWIVLKVVEFASAPENSVSISVTAGSLLFAAFMLALGKGAIDGYYRMVRNPPLVFALSQPLSRRSVVAAKLATVLSINMGFVALALGLGTGMILALRMKVLAGGLFIPALVCAAIGGLALGFAFSIAASLSTWRRKLTGLFLLALFPATAWIVLVQNEISLLNDFAFLLAIILPAIGVALAGSEWLVEAWNVQTSTPSRSGVRSSAPLRLPWMTAPQAAIFEKEVKTAWRKREILISLATIGLLSVALASVNFLMGEPPSGPAGVFVLPTLAMAGAYAGAALVLAVRGLSSIGGEFDSVWIMRTAPVDGHTVMVGKAVTYTILVPFVVVSTLPLSILAGFPLAVVALLAVGALIVSFLMTSLGLFFGARSPSFDRNTGGLPDSFTMYAVFILGLIACVVLVAPGVLVFLGDSLLGILVAILFADFAALILVFSIWGSGRRLDALEI